MSNNKSALLMRAIGEELSLRIIPELQSADAIERANFARMILQQLAADLDVLAEVAEPLVPEFRDAIDETLSRLPAGEFGDELSKFRSQLSAIAPEHGMARQREVAALRSLAAEIVRTLADLPRKAASTSAAGIDRMMARLGGLDHRWLTAYDAAKNKKNEHEKSGQPGATPLASTVADIDTESVTRYLRRRFPESPHAQATSVVSIPGGRSKKTYFISVKGVDSLPAELVMRQDYALRYEGTKVRDEYKPLVRLAELGLLVPRPLLLEAEESDLGPPFIFVERLRGAPPGSYFGMRTPCPGAFADLARMLAKLHRVNPAELGFSAGPASQDALMQVIDTYQKKWRDNATQPSPLVDYAYAWARGECAKDPGTLAVVHGDAGPYNLLVDNDRLTAVLDWEFVQVGDPAVDLGIVRVYVEDVMSWEEFMRMYTAAGGSPVPERRVRLAMVVQFLKGTTLVAASGRNFEEGWTREFIKGANAFTGMRLIELRIAGLLQRFGAV